MIVMMDRDETLRFQTINEVASYLGQVATEAYTEKVLTWAESTEQTLWIANTSHANDIWYKK